MRKYLLGLGLVLLAVALLAWFLPVRWVMPWIAPQLHGVQLRQPQGSVWDGRIGQLLADDGHDLGVLQWQLSRRAVFGDIRAQVALHGAPMDFSGSLQRLADGRNEWRGVHVRVDLDAVPAQPGLTAGQPRGELQATIDHAVLQGGWPLEMQATLSWQRASLRTADGDVSIGAVRGDARAQQGIVYLQWHDDGHGPLQMDGHLQASPLGWQLDATLRARQDDPSLHRWLSTLGTPGADGSLHIRQHGGLAADPPQAAHP